MVYLQMENLKLLEANRIKLHKEKELLQFFHR